MSVPEFPAANFSAMTLPPDQSLQRKYLRWSYILHGILFILPLIVLSGWLWDIPALRKMGSPVVAMNPLTAVSFLLTSCSFLILRHQALSPSIQKLGYGLAVLLFVIASCRVFGAITGADLAIDTWLFADKLELYAIADRPGRMSFNTSLCFLLASIALLLIRKEGKVVHYPTQYLALAVGLISLLSLLSYLYQTGSFFGFISYIPMALNTAIGFFLFSLTLLYAFPDKGIMRHITSKLSGSLTARVLFPAAILLPTFFGLLRLWGYWRGFYDTEFGVTLFSLVIIVTLIGIAWYTSISLNRREAEQMQIKQALEDRQEEINAVFQNAPDAIVVIDRDGRVIKWNPQSTRLFGWEGEEVTGKMLTDYIVPEELREAHRISMARYTGPENSSIIGKTIELRAVHRNGRPIDVAISISPFSHGDKTYFIGFIRDITEKKKIEKRLQQFNQELSLQVQEKTEELTDILDRIKDGFIALDKNFVYTYANKKIGEMTGKDPKDLIGKNVWEVFPDAVGTDTYKAFIQAMAKQEYVTNTNHIEPLELWQENHIYPSNRGLSVFIRDISEKMKAEKEIDNVRSLADKLIDSLPGVFYFYDEHGRFIRWNRQFEEMTEYSGEEIAGMHPTQFFADDEKAYITERILGVFEKGENDAEADLLSKSGRRVPHYFRATLITYDGKPCLLGTGIDMTEKRKAEEELKHSEQKYRLLFHSNPLAMWMLSLPDYHIIEANESALIQYGYTRDEFLQINVADMRPEEDKEKFIQVTNSNFRGIHYAGIWRHLKKDGSLIYVDVVTHDIMYEGKPVRLILANEVTEQYLAEERLKESYESIKRLTEHLNHVREQERLHIAREIHDELGQLLTVLIMDVSWLNRKLQPEPGPIKEKISELTLVLDTTVKTVRRISSELRPSLIDDLGLVAAMEWHIEEFEKRSGIHCEATLPKEELALSDSVKIGLFRILQESLTNVARHAKAKNVRVLLQKKENQLILTVNDDGIGFDESKRKKKTLGLVGARERAEGMGGIYSITGEPGKGTLVMVTIPV